MLTVVGSDALPLAAAVPEDAAFLGQVREIVEAVRTRGASAVRAYAIRFDGLSDDDPLVYRRADLEAAVAEIPDDQRELLERTAGRIRRFAEAQRGSLANLRVPVPGGFAGHTVLPVESAGCYAPGGRYPLVSSALMTAVTARAAGVPQVWLASPRPGTLMRAAAALAGADGLLAAGGAQAIAALAFGGGVLPPCAAVVGPGNRWVTAAKRIVADAVRIDMLAGPSELVVWADASGRADWIAADLLAQAEHDEEARPILVSDDRGLIEAVNLALSRQLGALETAAVARVALGRGAAVLVANRAEAAAVCDRLAPEHLELHVTDPAEALTRVRNYGCAFVGARTAEVLGDYGAGPNHTLPTGGTARTVSGLSVFSFLRTPTWLEMSTVGDDAMRADAIALAKIEGLAGHRRSAECRGER